MFKKLWKFVVDLKEDTNVFRYMLYPLLKISGLAPFYVQSDDASKNCFHLVYSQSSAIFNGILLVVLTILWFFYLPGYLRRDYWYRTEITQLVEIFLACTSIMCLISAIATTNIKGRALVKIINHLNIIKWETSKVRMSLGCCEKRNTALIIIVVILLQIVTLITAMIIAGEYFNIPLNGFIVVYSTSSINAFCTLQYFVLVLEIYAILNAINRTFLKLSKCEISNRTLIYQRLDQQQIFLTSATLCAIKLKVLRSMHTSICEICNEVSNFFSFPILCAVAYNFELSVNLFYFLVIPILASKEIDYIIVAVNIVSLFKSNIIIFMICIYADKVIKEVRY